MNKLFAVFLVVILVGCNDQRDHPKGKDLDQLPPAEKPGQMADLLSTGEAKRYRESSLSVQMDSIKDILAAQYDYRILGDFEETRKLYWRIRARASGRNPEERRQLFYASLYMSDAFFVNRDWDSANFYLNLAESFYDPLPQSMSRKDKMDEFLYSRSRIWERLGQPDSVIKVWKSQCIGLGQDVLARALRRRYGKDRMKEEIQRAMSNPVVTTLPLHFEGGQRIRSWITVLPDGDSVPSRDFGGLLVRLDLPGKSCYLWAPDSQDSLTSVPAYLNKFRKTRFCKILQDIDPDAPD